MSSPVVTQINTTHGKNEYFRFTDETGATLKDVDDNFIGEMSNAFNKLDFPRVRDTADTTRFGSKTETFVVGLEGTEISLDGLYDEGIEDLICGSGSTFDLPNTTSYTGSLFDAPVVYFSYGPRGRKTGYPEYFGTCILTENNCDGAIADAVKSSLKMRITGAIQRGTFATDSD